MSNNVRLHRGRSAYLLFFLHIVFDFTGSCQARHYIFRRRPTKEILFLHERHATIRPCHCHGNIVRGLNSFLLYIWIIKFHSTLGRKKFKKFWFIIPMSVSKQCLYYSWRYNLLLELLTQWNGEFPECYLTCMRWDHSNIRDEPRTSSPQVILSVWNSGSYYFSYTSASDTMETFFVAANFCSYFWLSLMRCTCNTCVFHGFASLYIDIIMFKHDNSDFILLAIFYEIEVSLVV